MISAGGCCPWEAEPHRGYADGWVVIESFPIDTHPVAQPISRRVVEGQAALVDPAAGGLPGEQDAGFPADPDNRTRLVRQVAGAGPAGGDLAQQAVQRAVG